MKQYVLYPELLGTDQLFPCDGRWSIETCINKAKEHANKLKRIHPHLSKGRVCRGPLRSPIVRTMFTF